MQVPRAVFGDEVQLVLVLEGCKILHNRGVCRPLQGIALEGDLKTGSGREME